MLRYVLSATGFASPPQSLPNEAFSHKQLNLSKNNNTNTINMPPPSQQRCGTTRFTTIIITAFALILLTQMWRLFSELGHEQDFSDIGVPSPEELEASFLKNDEFMCALQQNTDDLGTIQKEFNSFWKEHHYQLKAKIETLETTIDEMQNRFDEERKEMWYHLQEGKLENYNHEKMSAFHTVNAYFDRVFVINRRSDQEKWNLIHTVLSKMNITAERIEGLVPNDTSVEENYQYYLSIPLRKWELPSGKKAISGYDEFTHCMNFRNVLKEAELRKYRRILVLHDSVFFHSNFVQEFAERIQEIPPKWDLLFLGGYQIKLNESRYDRGWMNPSSLATQEQKKQALSQGWYHPKGLEGTFALGIDSCVFPTLLHEIESQSSPCDRGPLFAVQRICKNDCYAMYPNLVINKLPERIKVQFPSEEQMYKHLEWDIQKYAMEPPSNLKKEKVSVIMVTHNNAGTVEYAIKTLLNQTYTYMELVIIDDASTDQTVDKISAIATLDKRLRLKKNTEKQGISASKIAALKMASGELVMFTDPDEYSLPDRVTTLARPIINYQSLMSAALTLDTHVNLTTFSLPAELVVTAVETARVHWLNVTVDVKEGVKTYSPCCKQRLTFSSLTFHKSILPSMGKLSSSAKFTFDEELVERFLAHYARMFFSYEDTAFHFVQKNQVPGWFKRVDQVVSYGPENKRNKQFQSAVENEATITKEREQFRNDFIHGMCENCEYKEFAFTGKGE